MERKHVHADSVVYIGKEANNIDEQALDVKKAQLFYNEEKIKKDIISLPQKITEEWGADRKTFQRILERNEINLNTASVRSLIEKLV